MLVATGDLSQATAVHGHLVDGPAVLGRLLASEQQVLAVETDLRVAGTVKTLRQHSQWHLAGEDDNPGTIAVIVRAHPARRRSRPLSLRAHRQLRQHNRLFEGRRLRRDRCRSSDPQDHGRQRRPELPDAPIAAVRRERTAITAGYPAGSEHGIASDRGLGTTKYDSSSLNPGSSSSPAGEN